MGDGTEDDLQVGDVAVFTFGKCRFSDNAASKFWIKNDAVKQVACGDEHSIVITESGKGWAFGNNEWGQLGLPDGPTVNKPSLIKDLKDDKIKYAAAGRSHSLLATESGKIFSCGNNNEGQLGLGDTKDRKEPQEIKGVEGPVKMVSAGSFHSAILTVSGLVFVFGSNSEGQLGLGEGCGGCQSPQELKMSHPVICIACGYYHTALVTDNGELYTFGEKENKLGLSTVQLQKANRPQRVSISDKIIWVSCGGSHTAAVAENGNLYTFGSGIGGQLGQGGLVLESPLPALVKGLSTTKALRAFCGECHTAVLTEDGKLFTFGDGRHGKLGHGNENFSNEFLPVQVKLFKDDFTVQQAACGGCHMIVVAKKVEDNLKTNGIEDSINSKMITELESDTTDAHLDTARNRRRIKEKNGSQSLERTLPPLIKVPHISSIDRENQALFNTQKDVQFKEQSKMAEVDLSTSQIPQPNNEICEPDEVETNQPLPTSVKPMSLEKLNVPYADEEIESNEYDENVIRNSDSDEELNKLDTVMKKIEQVTENNSINEVKKEETPDMQPQSKAALQSEKKHGDSLFSRIFSFKKGKEKLNDKAENKKKNCVTIEEQLPVIKEENKIYQSNNDGSSKRVVTKMSGDASSTENKDKTTSSSSKSKACSIS